MEKQSRKEIIKELLDYMLEEEYIEPAEALLLYKKFLGDDKNVRKPK